MRSRLALIFSRLGDSYAAIGKAPEAVRAYRQTLGLYSDGAAGPLEEKIEEKIRALSAP